MAKKQPLTDENERLKDFDKSVHDYFKSAEETQPLQDVLTKEEWIKIFVELHSLAYKLVFDEDYGEERKEQNITEFTLEA